MKRALVVCIAVALSACTTVDPTLRSLRELSGTYADPPSGYAYGAAFGKRTFTFDKGTWTLDFTLALDPAFQAKVFRFRTRGTYDVLGPSAKVSGAYDAVFKEDVKLLTLVTSEPGLVQGFGLGSCGLTPGVEKDISIDGCAAWKPVAACNEDHDLLALTAEGGVRFGVRPQDNDMCTEARRPTELTPAVSPQAPAGT